MKATAEADHRNGLGGEESELLEKHRQHAQDMLEKRAKRRSKRPKAKKPVIANTAVPPATQQKTVKPAVQIRMKKRPVLSLKRGAA